MKAIAFAASLVITFASFSPRLANGESGPPDLLIGKSPSRLMGGNVYDRNRPSNRQRLVTSKNIYTENTARATLRLENDGTSAGKFRLKSSGDKRRGMTVSARLAGGGNVSAGIKSGRFSQTLAPGGSATIRYSLRTNRFYAGVLNAGDRRDEIRFRMSGAGQKDNAALLIKYILPAGPTRID